jgi:hypothetical protein
VVLRHHKPLVQVRLAQLMLALSSL